MIIGKDLYNSYYEEDEKLFSTGDSELDDLLTEVYYSGLEDGYDYAQKEFSSKLKLGTRLQAKAIEKSDRKEKARREEFDKNVASFDDDMDKGFYQDALKLRQGKMTEDEFIAKHPWTAKKKYRK